MQIDDNHLLTLTDGSFYLDGFKLKNIKSITISDGMFPTADIKIAIDLKPESVLDVHNG